MPWIGDNGHITETCEDGLSAPMTCAETAVGPVDDGEATCMAHAALQHGPLGKIYVYTGTPGES